jgi:hypothetical protein
MLLGYPENSALACHYVPSQLHGPHFSLTSSTLQYGTGSGHYWIVMANRDSDIECQLYLYVLTSFRRMQNC